MNADYAISKDFKGRFKVVCTLTSGQGNEFVGQAICSLDDTFDPERGMSLALNRARQKQMNRILTNRTKDYEDVKQKYLRAMRAMVKADDVMFELSKMEFRLMKG
jgi:hypothetical protein